MTEESPPLVPSNEQKSSTWNFAQFNEEEDDDQSSENCDDFFSVLKKTVAKNLYFDEKIPPPEAKKTNQRSTVRLDSSDLISRCQQFLPLLTDANRNLFSQIKSGENVRMELDSDEEQERTIEMNLMFCPNIDSSSSESEEEPTIIPVHKKSQSVNIVEVEKSEENVHN